MSWLSTIRSNWRVFALTIIVVVSLGALVAPGFKDTDGPTNLQYGIELDGGTRLRAPVAGYTAENVALPDGNASVEAQVASSLGIQQSDVIVRGSGGNATIEMLSRNVTQDEYVTALRDAGVTVQSADVRRGVTAETRADLVRAINNKIDAAGLSGATAREASTPTGDYFIVIEAPGRDAQELRSFLTDRGTVRVDAYYPQDGRFVNETVLQQGDFSNIGIPQNTEQSGWILQVTVNDTAAPRFSEQMVDAGFGDGSTCRFRGYGSIQASPDTGCLLVISDGEVVSNFSVTPGLGETFRTGEFSQSPTMVFDVRTGADARELMVHLRAGRLPALLDFERDDTLEVSPALAENFKLYSLVTGLAAVFAVAGTVFVRYRDPRIAAPMVVTALSEVVILLGAFAVGGFALDLSHIAGFIAVIGTGVDDLVIIADEVMAEGDVASGRVFQNRFRKAFWVIGAAAATTIIAMSPLAFLQLGDLMGFALVTILGVLVGVLITRPAYGDILRALLTDR